MLIVRTDTSDGLLVTTLVLEADRSGWTMCGVVEQKQTSMYVHMETGDVTTVLTEMMSPSLA